MHFLVVCPESRDLLVVDGMCIIQLVSVLFDCNLNCETLHVCQLGLIASLQSSNLGLKVFPCLLKGNQVVMVDVSKRQQVL